MIRLGRPALLIVASVPIIFATIGSTAASYALDDAKAQWDRQLQVHHFEANLCSLKAAAEAVTVGEGVGNFRQQAHSAYREYAALSTGEDSQTFAKLGQDFESLIRAYGISLELCEQGNFAQARSFDEAQTDRLFDRVQKEIHAIQRNLNRTAESNKDRSTLLSMIGAVASALVASALFLSYLRSSGKMGQVLQEKEMLEHAQRRLAALLRKSDDIVAVLSTDGTFSIVTGACERLLNRSPSLLIGRTPDELCHPSDLGLLRYFIKRMRSGEPELRTEIRFADGHGSFRPFRIHFSNLVAHPDVKGIVLTLHDLTERKTFEQELTHQAFHDLLTGLPNRSLFADRLSQCVSRSRDDHREVVVMFLDLDNFKLINDTLGHEVGDKLLLAVAERLQQCVDPTTMLARIGGDEFVLLASADTTLAQAKAMAHGLIKALREPFVIAGREIFASCSIGISSASGPAADADALLREADTAMYRAKAEGKSSFAVFTAEMNDQAVERLDLESDLRRALAGNQLVLHYQPIVDLVTLRLKQFEVLVRWQHPTRGLISPLKFIPIAEETGLIREIGLWILREGCRQAAHWNAGKTGMNRVRVSINVSGKQLQEPSFVQCVRQVIEDTGVEAADIELEVTESVMLHDFDHSFALLSALRQLGVGVAIDDFGTGYSSMSYLSRLPIDKLKIDRSFISALSEEHGEHIVRAIIAMAKNLHLEVTSEGIENTGQQRVLQSLGCELGQGFLYAKPLPASEVDELLRQDFYGPQSLAA